MTDKNGVALCTGDSVLVDEPMDTIDLWNCSFIGTVYDFEFGDVLVIDDDGFCFDIEPERLEILNN